MTGSKRTQPRGKLDHQVGAVMEGAQVLVGVVAHSLAGAGDTVTLPQLRVLVMVHRHGQLNLAAVATGLGVHASTASRTCDPLVKAGLLGRADDPCDRRHLALTLTPQGQQLVDSVLDHRREAIRELLRRMPPARREHLADAMGEFAKAAGDYPSVHAAELGWTH